MAAVLDSEQLWPASRAKSPLENSEVVKVDFEKKEAWTTFKPI